MNRARVFVDGPDLYRQERDTSTRFAYHAVRDWASECGLEVSRVGYYASPVPRGGFVRIRPLLDYLSANGTEVVESVNALYSHIVIDAVTAEPSTDWVLVVSSSPALAPLGHALRRKGSKLLVACVTRFLSTDLRSAADEVIPLENTGLLEKFDRPKHGDR